MQLTITEIAEQIKAIEAKRRHCEVEIGTKLIEARQLMKSIQGYFEWANREFGFDVKTVSRYESIARTWQGTAPEIIDRISPAALHAVVQTPEVKGMAIAAAAAGQTVTRDNVINFRAKVEPAQAEIVAAPTQRKEAAVSNLDMMAIQLDYYRTRADVFSNLLMDIFRLGTVNQDHLDRAVQAGLFDELELINHAATA